MTDLAKLVVRLEAQTAQYMAQLDRANKRLEKFDKQAEVSAGRIAKGVVAAAASAAVAFGAMALNAVSAADDMGKLAQSSGIAVESLSQLEYAADLSGTSLAGLVQGMNKLTKSAADAARGSKTSADAFKAIGVSAQNADGSLKDTEQLMLDVADRFSAIEDGAAKAAVAQELFGKSGVKLIPFLNQGRAGIEALKKEADALGLTITNKTAKAAEEFNDNLDRIKLTGKGLANQAAAELLPVFSAMAERFAGAAVEGSAMDFAIKALSATLKTLVSAGVIVTSVFEQLGQIIYGVGAAIVRVSQGEFSLAADEISSAFENARSNVTEDMETIAKVWADTVPEIETAAKGMDDALKETIIFSDDKAKEAAEKAAASALEAIQKLEQGLRQQVETYGMSEEAVIRYRIANGDLAESFREAGAAAEPYKESIVELTAELEDLQAATERQADLQASLDKAIADNIEATRKQIEDDLEAMNKAAEEQSDFERKARENLQDVLASGIEEMIDEGFSKGADKAFDIFKDMLKKMAAQALAAQLGNLIFGQQNGGFGGTGGGGGGSGGGGWWGAAMDFVGGLFGGSRDNGGRGKRGHAYAIGRGAQPEMFVPDTSGTFIPAHQWMGRSQKIEQNIYVQGRVDQRSARQLELESVRRQNAAASRLG